MVSKESRQLVRAKTIDSAIALLVQQRDRV
mgnify:CR=1 FL=1